MRIALIADSYPPIKNSASIQIRDLSDEFGKQGHDIILFIPDSELAKKNNVQILGNITLVRLKTLRTKDVGNLKRVIAEFLLPYFMMLNLPSTISIKFDGVVWYSPSIFLTPFPHFLKLKSKCKTYLIIRDIFPEWAVHLGLMRRGLIYYFLKLISWYQYAVADTIGMQSKGNEIFFPKWVLGHKNKIEVLNNWQSVQPKINCSIDLSKTKLANRKIFIYAGNVGVAQNIFFLIDLVTHFRNFNSIGFIIIGRGTHFEIIRELANNRNLQNILFYDEIDPDELSSLLLQCHVGLVSLDIRHKTHNIPGKFLSYMNAGIPVLAIVNPANDLIDLIEGHGVGLSYTGKSIFDFSKLAEKLLIQIDVDPFIKSRCYALSGQLFETSVAVKKIIYSLEDK